MTYLMLIKGGECIARKKARVCKLRDWVHRLVGFLVEFPGGQKETKNIPPIVGFSVTFSGAFLSFLAPVTPDIARASHAPLNREST